MRPTSAILATPSRVSKTLGDLRAHKASVTQHGWVDRGVGLPALRVPALTLCEGLQELIGMPGPAQRPGQACSCLRACMRGVRTCPVQEGEARCRAEQLQALYTVQGFPSFKERQRRT